MDLNNNGYTVAISPSSLWIETTHSTLNSYFSPHNLKMASADAYTAPFMLTKSMYRDVYPAIDPAHNKDLRADSKVIIIFGATSGLGFVCSYLYLCVSAFR